MWVGTHVGEREKNVINHFNTIWLSEVSQGSILVSFMFLSQRKKQLQLSKLHVLGHWYRALRDSAQPNGVEVVNNIFCCFFAPPHVPTHIIPGLPSRQILATPLLYCYAY